MADAKRCGDKIEELVEAIEDLLRDPNFGLEEIKCEVREIENKLDNPCFGLREIKEEIKAIEEKLDHMVPANGALSTGPFFVRTGESNAVNVKVQNVGTEPVDVVVRLFDIAECPPESIDSAVLTDIGECCSEEATLTAPAGNFEVAICPVTPNALLRAFVSVHSGASANSSFEYVFRAAEILPLVCPFCEDIMDEDFGGSNRRRCPR